MGVDFEQEIREIFGTTDLTALREISKAANEYQHMVEKSVRKQASGRKNSFTEPQIARILALQSQGEKITSIAKQYQVSRQTIYSQIQRAHQFNYTDQIPLRAFGVVEHPDWADFQYFLEDRCFPKTRDHAKEILRELGVPFYDPLLIIEKTKGRMEGDHQWILILKKEECR